jgi:serine protease
VPPATVSGTVSVLDITLVDSDTNDPLQQGRAANDTPSTTQAAGNPSLVVGYVNEPGKGPDGSNKVDGDEWDIYGVDLVTGQVVELNFGDSSTADVDLYITDAQGNVLGRSIGVTRSECVRITRSGNYRVAVTAFDGASAYELTWGPPRPDSSCANAATAAGAGASFVAGEVIAKPRADQASAAVATKGAVPTYAKATALLDQLGMVRKAGLGAGQASLLSWPEDGDARRKFDAGLAALSVPAGTSLMKAARHRAFAGASDQTRRAFETIVTAKRLAASGAFEYVELNEIDHPLQVGYGNWPPNDEYLSRQPHYGLIKLPQAFDALAALSPRPGYTPIAAVVDTGIVANHPDLQRMLVPGFDFVSDATRSGDGNGIDADPDDANGNEGGFHGTHVAGTIAAEAFNGRGVIGVAPMARVMPVRVLGLGGGTAYDIAQGIRFAAGSSNDSGRVPGQRADVINLSLGGAGTCPSIYADAVAAARAQGSIVVAATGNEAAPVGRPANCPGVIAVSAVSYDLRLSSFSNSGPEVAVTAPGGDQRRSSPAGPDLIFSTVAAITSGTRRPVYDGYQGTSMATPHVAGVLALMRAVNPDITPAQVDSLLSSGAMTDDLGAAGRDSSFGYGLINAVKSITAAGAAGSTPPPPVQNLPTLAVTPVVLDFGTTQTQLEVVVSRINSSTDSPSSYEVTSLDRQAVTVTAASGNPAAGPYRLLVTVDRARLSPGENVVRVNIVSAQDKRVSFDVSVTARTAAPVGLRGVGPVYVLALDANTFASAGQANVTSVGLSYPYAIANVTSAQVVIAAGTDTDNDGFICGSSEPCGYYPVMGGQPVLIDMGAGNRTGIDFQLVSGGESAASTLPTTFARPAKGFRRDVP